MDAWLPLLLHASTGLGHSAAAVKMTIVLMTANYIVPLMHDMNAQLLILLSLHCR